MIVYTSLLISTDFYKRVIQTLLYKVGDPILLLESDRFCPIIHNNMKKIIQGIEIIDEDTLYERIQFDVEVSKAIDVSTCLDLQLL